MEVYQPCTLAVLRLVIAFCALVPILLVRGTWPLVTRQSMLLGITGVALFQILQNTGLQMLPAGPSVLLLYGGTAIFTTLLGRCLLKEPCSFRVAGALAVSALGVGLVAFKSEDGRGFGFDWLGIVLLLGAAAAFAIYTVAGRRSTMQDITALNAGMLLAGIVSILPLAVREEQPAWQAMLRWPDLVELVMLGSLVTAGSYLCWAYGIRHLQANEASVLCSVEPAFGLVFAWVMLHEGISAYEMIGAAVIVASCVVVAGGVHEPESIPAIALADAV